MTSCLIKKLWLLLALLSVFSCSTEKNNFLNRKYHSTTARYNGLFNANELLRLSLITYDGSHKDDFYTFLPVNPLPNDKEVIGMYPAIDTAIAKCTKVIEDHSMPNAVDMYYKEAEYNNWIDENWLTIGKAFYYRRDYEKALSNFEFVKRFFIKDPSTYIAQLWIAKVYIELSKFSDAKLILDGLNEIAQIQKKKKFKDFIPFLNKKKGDAAQPTMTRSLQLEIYKAYSDLAMKRKDYEAAIDGLQLALSKSNSPREKARFNYILAQLYQNANNSGSASYHFKKAIKASASFELAFNARLNSAVADGSEGVKKDLKKMARDSKNAAFKDQIFYALGLVELNNNREQEAKDYLTKSAFFSLSNKRQKAMSYEKLGDMSFFSKEFVPAQKYYDSCARFMPEDYPNAEIVKNKSTKLYDLVKALETANFEDSVERIAKLSAKDREIFLKETLKQMRREIQAAKEKEAAKLLALQSNSAVVNNTNTNKFIFNNPKLRETGFKEFKKLWGARDNEDNWRRSDKLPVINNLISSDSSQNIVAQESKDSLSYEKLLKNIPLSDSAFSQSQLRLIDALYTSGILFKEVLLENELAEQQFESALALKLSNNTDLSAAFQLFRLNEQNKKSEKYKSYILDKYPNSDAAKYFLDPDFYLKQKKNAEESQKDYLKLLEQYQLKAYQTVYNLSQTILEKDLANSCRSEYMLLNVLAMGQLTQDKSTLIPKLNLIIEEKPQTEQAKRAKEMLDIIQSGYSKNEELDFNKKYFFEYVSDVPQYVIVLLDEEDDTDFSKGTISDFAVKKFKSSKLRVSSKITLSEKSFILVQEFASISLANKFIDAYKAGFEFIDDLQDNKIFIITQENLKKLIETAKFEEYKLFYNDNY
jgi:tetratricopeptide (TPR) repeat protein